MFKFGSYYKNHLAKLADMHKKLVSMMPFCLSY